MLIDASMIHSIPAATHNTGEFGITMSASDARMAPARKYGRRRPYFLAGGILASLAVIVMPNSPVLWVAAGMLWIMDASINIAMEPFRAFVGDNLRPDQRTVGFAM